MKWQDEFWEFLLQLWRYHIKRGILRCQKDAQVQIKRTLLHMVGFYPSLPSYLNY